MAFYTYTQNKTGGIYSYNDKLAKHVIIEADDAYTANNTASELGIYFDGNGDCTCCGKRWDEYNITNAGTFYPEIETQQIDYTYKPEFTETNILTVIVYFKDGRTLKI